MAVILDSWPFGQAPNVAAVTTARVLDDGYPILLVAHYSDDHSWGFFCGTTSQAEDGRVISMRTALAIDSTLADIADLPPGWSARRHDVNSEWHRYEDPDI